ncbi:MJ0042-type zinc finger domain-containing protein [Paenibacillus sp. BR1-192]|uniref:MJ0042-type zinc finger domain-containing protein n=1 Tax=Paenibacillus sp. BR1-192 TaxID=3032287 RepID=UPI00240E072B|nr:MJ0042-type zinc finger domain-containing protein [Paenibacillus sp. BR1-192]WFB60538.1 hypothetical protein P0X86_10180 [Paenibacillus sp. BR1-192]
MRDLTISSLFGDADIDMECPSCNTTFKVKFQDVLEEGNSVICPGCNQEIRIEHDQTAKKSLEDGNESLHEFNKAFKDLEKTFKKF